MIEGQQTRLLCPPPSRDLPQCSLPGLLGDPRTELGWGFLAVILSTKLSLQSPYCLSWRRGSRVGSRFLTHSLQILQKQLTLTMGSNIHPTDTTHKTKAGRVSIHTCPNCTALSPVKSQSTEGCAQSRECYLNNRGRRQDFHRLETQSQPTLGTSRGKKQWNWVLGHFSLPRQILGLRPRAAIVGPSLSLCSDHICLGTVLTGWQPGQSTRTCSVI